ncbi:hypothetical protein TWF694_008955 [Orbilia ellipsospora]|uniref:Uncharacterized protein n=1 Tax=Orbilia ellipsospora TaxID=2528407 RepID=A0AAV9XE03_9PEZI
MTLSRDQNLHNTISNIPVTLQQPQLRKVSIRAYADKYASKYSLTTYVLGVIGMIYTLLGKYLRI